MTPALECEQITKSFGGLDALDQVTLKVELGERRAIIGPNGAGKTTLFKIISGEFQPTAGNIRLFGKDVTGMKAHKRAYLGLGRTFQINNLFPSLSVLDNLILSQAGLQRLKYQMFKPINLYEDLYHRVWEILERMALEGRRNEIIEHLSHGEQRQIEIAMALINKPKILLLDEPTSGLSSAESKMITKMIKELDRDITILIIEHDMDVAFEVASFITVLNFGKVFAEGDQADIRNDKEVKAIYFGTEEGMRRNGVNG